MLSLEQLESVLVGQILEDANGDRCVVTEVVSHHPESGHVDEHLVLKTDCDEEVIVLASGDISYDDQHQSVLSAGGLWDWVESLSCSTCLGVGEATHVATDSYGWNTSVPTLCPSCEGSGRRT